MIDFEDIELLEGRLAPPDEHSARGERSAIERAREPVASAKSPAGNESRGRSGEGCLYNVDFACSQQELARWGPGWLTKAFRVAGVLSDVAEVRSIKEIRQLRQRDGVLHLMLEVEYAPLVSECHRHLLVRVSNASTSKRSALATGQAVILNAHDELDGTVGILHKFDEETQRWDVVLPEGGVQQIRAKQVSPVQGQAPFGPHPLSPPRERWTSSLAEINAFRLLEAATEVRMPKYYFGEICPSTLNSILITEWVPRPSEDFGAAHSSEAWHLDTLNADLELTAKMLEAAARLAGASASGSLGSREDLHQHFGEPALNTIAASFEGQVLALGDRDFSERTLVCTDFITKVAKACFPPDVVSPASMKAFRATLVTARGNFALFNWWLNNRPEHIVLGHDCLLPDSAFAVECEEGSTIGLRDWGSLSLGPVATKIWQWLSCADYDVLALHLEELIWHFIGVFHQSGGAILDRELLTFQVFVAVAMQCVATLDAVPHLYQQIPKQEWAYIGSLNDVRILQHRGGLSLWHVLKCIANMLVVVNHFNIVNLLEKRVGLIFVEHCLGAPLPDFRFPYSGEAETFTACPQGVRLRPSPSKSAPLMCCIPPGSLLVKAITPPCTVPKGWTRIATPLPSWALSCELQQDNSWGESRKEDNPATEWLALMFHTRRQYQANSPMGSCLTSAKKLLDEMLIREKVEFLQTRLGRGEARLVIGSFLAEERRRSWWPKGYVDWQHHSFLAFEDGSIADITADQFDDVPQLWWPADASRYSFDVRDADNAHRARSESVGIERWQELVEGDSTPSAKTRQKWMRIERQRDKQDELALAREHWRELLKREPGVPDRPRVRVDVREPLLLVGNCNDWNLEKAQANFRFEFNESSSPKVQESFLKIRVPNARHGDFLAFQIISARQLWDWRLYPDGEANQSRRLLCDYREHVPVALLEGGDHSKCKGADFHVMQPCTDQVYIWVSLSARRKFHVWYTECFPT